MENRKCPFCGKTVICVNTQDGEFTCTSCAEYANHDVLDFIENLKAENERLKGELEMEHDDCSNAKKCEIEYHKAYEKELDENVTLRKTRHALWIARANAAKHLVVAFENYDYLYFGKLTIKQESAKTWMTCTIHTPAEWVKIWENVQDKCRKKAKEYE